MTDKEFLRKLKNALLSILLCGAKISKEESSPKSQPKIEPADCSHSNESKTCTPAAPTKKIGRNDEMHRKLKVLSATHINCFVLTAECFNEASKSSIDEDEYHKEGYISAELFAHSLLSLRSIFTPLGNKMVSTFMNSDLEKKANAVRTAIATENLFTLRDLFEADKTRKSRMFIGVNLQEELLWAKRTLEFGYNIFYNLVLRNLDLPEAARAAYVSALERHHVALFKPIFRHVFDRLPNTENYLRMLYDVSEVDEKRRKQFEQSVELFLSSALPHIVMLRNMFPEDES